MLQESRKNLRIKISNFYSNYKRFIFRGFIVLILSLFGYFISSNIVIAYGKSIDKKVFWRVDFEKLERGNYVLVKADDNDIFAKGKLISKMVGCASGETLEIKGDEYYCMDNYLGKAKHQSRTGIPVKPFNPCGSFYCIYKIPDNHYFVIGTHKDSYDSRYFGPINKEKILARLLPIW